MTETSSRETQAAAGRTIEAATEIAAPIEVVWKALTDAAELTGWFPLEARVTPGPGGSIWMSWRNEYTWDIPIEIWDPPHRLRLAYERPAEPPEASGAANERGAGAGEARPPLQLAIDYQLEARGGTTFLRLVHSGFGSGEAWDEEFEATERGWAFELAALRLYLERHRGRRRRVAWARFRVELPRGETWARLIGPEGLRLDPEGPPPAPGDPCVLRPATGDVLRGSVISYDPPKQLGALVENLNDGVLRIWLDNLPLRGVRDVNVWFSIYDAPEEEVDALRARWLELLHRLYPGATALQ